jgi:hypothetical protein
MLEPRGGGNWDIFPPNELGTHPKSKSKPSAPRAHAAATKNPFGILIEGLDDGERTDDEENTGLV